MIRILFVDLDGVVMTLRSKLSDPNRSRDCMDAVVTNFIGELCRRYGIQIVISSNRRHQTEECLGFMRKAGLDVYLHNDWCTHRYTSEELIVPAWTRGEEIAEWLLRHADVESYRIIDDDLDIMDDQKKYMIACEADNGLDARGMTRLLNWADPKWQRTNKRPMP